jgi:general secretion pathway protein L
VILISPPPDPDPSSATWLWAHAPDGVALAAHGSGWPTLPTAQARCVLVLPPQRLSWHQVSWPRTPVHQREAVLVGLLEEQLLDDPETLHMALSPALLSARAPTQGWVAACDKAWLRACLDALNAQGWTATRILPAIVPQGPGQLWADHAGGTDTLVVASERGVCVLPMAQTVGGAGVREIAEQCLGGGLPAQALSTPAAIAAAQAVWPACDWKIAPALACALQTYATAWDLAQGAFRLSEGVRRRQAWAEGLGALWRAPAWRAWRWGMLALVGVHWVGLQAAAWQAQAHVSALQASARQLVTDTFAHVTPVINAPLQMQREVQLSRAAHGHAAPADLEPLLQSLGELALQNPWRLHEIDYDASGRVRLAHTPLSPPDLMAMRQRLEAAGWRVEASPEQTQLFRTGQP